MITEVLYPVYTSAGSGELSILTSARIPACTDGVGIWGWGLSVNCFLKFPHHSNVQPHFPLDFFLSSLVAFIPFYFYIIILFHVLSPVLGIMFLAFLISVSFMESVTHICSTVGAQ